MNVKWRNLMEKIARLIQPMSLLLLVCLVKDGYLPRRSHAQPATPAFSLSCRDASLRDVLGNLAAQKGINLAGLDVIPPTVSLTTHLNTVPLEVGLLALLEPKGFTVENRGGIYFISQLPLESQRLLVNISDGKLSVDANLTDVHRVIDALAQAGISITSASNLTGQVTAHLHAQPLDKALPVLFADFTLHAADGIYRVEPPSDTIKSGLKLFIADGQISVTAHKTKLTELLAELADRTQINLSIVGDIKRNITLRIDDRTVIVKAYGADDGLYLSPS